jgi:hypothetical protein
MEWGVGFHAEMSRTGKTNTSTFWAMSWFRQKLAAEAKLSGKRRAPG